MNFFDASRIGKMGNGPSRFAIGGDWMNGIFLVDKPMNKTSQSVVNIIKHQFGLKKCGHNGTLDPDTTGLMVVACDEATKLMKYLSNHNKAYDTTIIFGFDSDTLDMSGKISKEIDMSFSMAELESAIKELKCAKTQIPPLYSAIKVQGKKLYDYARKNQDVILEPRSVNLYQVELLSELREVDKHLEIDLRLFCSKGYYVRSFARDLGKLLQGCAIMKTLRRIQSGPFNIEQAIPLNQLNETHLLSIPEIFKDFGRIEVNDYIAKLVLNGVILDERQIKTEKPFYVLHKNDIIAIYESFGLYQYKPVVIFKN